MRSAVGDVFEDRLRERVRLLEHHPDAAPQADDVERRARRCRRRRSATVPSTRVPGMMSFIRFSVRRNVLLPQPDGPMNAVTRFDRSWTEMSVQRALRAVIEVHPFDVDFDRRQRLSGSDRLRARRK